MTPSHLAFVPSEQAKSKGKSHLINKVTLFGSAYFFSRACSLVFFQVSLLLNWKCYRRRQKLYELSLFGEGWRVDFSCVFRCSVGKLVEGGVAYCCNKIRWWVLWTWCDDGKVQFREPRRLHSLTHSLTGDESWSFFVLLAEHNLGDLDWTNGRTGPTERSAMGEVNFPGSQ